MREYIYFLHGDNFDKFYCWYSKNVWVFVSAIYLFDQWSCINQINLVRDSTRFIKSWHDRWAWFPMPSKFEYVPETAVINTSLSHTLIKQTHSVKVFSGKNKSIKNICINKNKPDAKKQRESQNANQ